MSTQIELSILVVLGCLFVLVQEVWAHASEIPLRFGYVSDEPVLANVGGMSLQQCFENCRKNGIACTGLAYSRYDHMCILYEQGTDVAALLKNRRYVYSNASAWTTESSHRCNETQRLGNRTCDTNTSGSSPWDPPSADCVAIYCSTPERIPYAFEFGNMSFVGAKRRWKCKGAPVQKGLGHEARCLISGNWTRIDLRCLPFGDVLENKYLDPFEIIPHTIKTDGISRRDCVRRCFEDTELCMSVNYHAQDRICIQTANLDYLDGHTTQVRPLSGWTVIQKVFPIFLATDVRRSRYGLTHETAIQRCRELGTEIATYEDLQSAYNMGYSDCQCSFVKDRWISVYAIHVRHTYCGDTIGINECLFMGAHQTGNVYCKNVGYVPL